jgi:creatinine amidohydrolase/Fe(II)-dependent formamide hydrolase-like protein
MSRRLADAVWPDIPARPLVLVPVGSIEQHGPHLPLDTDAVIAEAVADRAAELIGGDVQVAPVIAYGSSGEHQMFPGTCSIGADALRSMLVELVRSLRTWAGRVVFVNAHGATPYRCPPRSPGCVPKATTSAAWPARWRGWWTRTPDSPRPR